MFDGDGSNSVQEAIHSDRHTHPDVCHGGIEDGGGAGHGTGDRNKLV